MGSTSIEWTSGPNKEPGYTFNPWLGCAKVHEGCTHCYAERSQPVTMRAGGRVDWGEVWQGGKRVVVSDSTWKNPLRWAREAAAAGQRRKVFCASLADVLEVPMPPKRWPSALSRMEVAAATARVEKAQREMGVARERLWNAIRSTAIQPDMGSAKDLLNVWPGLDWLLLTKRPENWHLVPEDVRPLVWLGTSISTQETAVSLVPKLLCSQGFRYRFLSVEPMLGPVRLDDLALEQKCEQGCGQPVLYSALSSSARCGCTVEGNEPVAWQRLDWVVFGFESGPEARPGHVEWIRDGLEQCRKADVAAFVKQLGAEPAVSAGEAAGARRRGAPGAWRLDLTDHKGRDPAEWPEWLRVRQWPNDPRGGKP